MPLQSLSCMHLKPGMAHLLDTHAVTSAGSAVLCAFVLSAVAMVVLVVVVGGCLIPKAVLTGSSPVTALHLLAHLVATVALGLSDVVNASPYAPLHRFTALIIHPLLYTVAFGVPVLHPRHGFTTTPRQPPSPFHLSYV